MSDLEFKGYGYLCFCAGNPLYSVNSGLQLEIPEAAGAPNGHFQGAPLLHPPPVLLAVELQHLQQKSKGLGFRVKGLREQRAKRKHKLGRNDRTEREKKHLSLLMLVRV